MPVGESQRAGGHCKRLSSFARRKHAQHVEERLASGAPGIDGLFGGPAIAQLNSHNLLIATIESPCFVRLPVRSFFCITTRAGALTNLPNPGKVVSMKMGCGCSERQT